MTLAFLYEQYLVKAGLDDSELSLLLFLLLLTGIKSMTIWVVFFFSPTKNQQKKKTFFNQKKKNPFQFVFRLVQSHLFILYYFTLLYIYSILFIIFYFILFSPS